MHNRRDMLGLSVIDDLLGVIEQTFHTRKLSMSRTPSARIGDAVLPAKIIMADVKFVIIDLNLALNQCKGPRIRRHRQFNFGFVHSGGRQ
jgi:hypothetical protein